MGSMHSLLAAAVLAVLVAAPVAAQEGFDPVTASGEGFERIVVDDENYGYFLTAAKWRSTRIAVCWESVELAFEPQRALVQAAVASSWERHSAVRFTGWTGCPARNFIGIRIATRNEWPHTKTLGAKISGTKDGMVLNFDFDMPEYISCRSSRSFYDQCIISISVHEFGHALGFAHEQNRSDVVERSCFERAVGLPGDVELTPYDLKSVMNYCNPKYLNYGVLSAGDILSVQKIYGAMP